MVLSVSFTYNLYLRYDSNAYKDIHSNKLSVLQEIKLKWATCNFTEKNTLLNMAFKNTIAFTSLYAKI